MSVAIDIAADISTRPEFSSFNSPLILDVVTATLDAQRTAVVLPRQGSLTKLHRMIGFIPTAAERAMAGEALSGMLKELGVEP